MALEELTGQISSVGMSPEEQIRILRKSRAQLLEEIHEKQQLLDHLDYMIYEIKNEKKEITTLAKRREIL